MKSLICFRTIACTGLLAIMLATSGRLGAQTTPAAEWSSWWFGVYGGANINTFSGTLYNLSAVDPPVVASTGFNEGSGVGLAAGLLGEYNPGGTFGGRLGIGYDNRSITFTGKATGTLAEALVASPAYLSIDPSLRINIASRFFHITLGPTIGINVAKGYDYTRGTGTSKQDLGSARSVVLGGAASVGYDIPLAGPDAKTQILLTPYAGFHLGQGLLDNSIDTNKFGVTSIRVGLQLKFAGGPPPPPDTEVTPPINFSTKAPNVVTESRKLNETFPLRNYMFFEAGSTEIPARYKKLSPAEAGNFREEQLKTSAETGLQDPLQIRSRKQMDVYYNGLNVFGDRMRANPSATATIIGAANGSAATGKQMAESVKNYLVTSFGIDATRINTEGRTMPASRSGSSSSSRDDKALIDAENYRVDFVSNPTDLMKPVTIVTTQEQPMDNDIVVTLAEPEKVASWSAEITERDGATTTYGPFTTGSARIDSKALLGTKRDSRYTINLKGTTKNGKPTSGQPNEFRLVRADVGDEQKGMRYSILFEFDDSKTVDTYANFLRESVAPAIPDGAAVIIHGHTDAIGEVEHNLKLSQDRCAKTMAVLKAELDKAGKTVTFDSYGFGEDASRAMFDNNLPEQRYYNRTVVIEVVPKQ